ncbi:MAG: hypothetical protein AAFZ07_25460 [Actinomycetota bacterium]
MPPSEQSPDAAVDPAEIRDELPEDLDRGFVGPYQFPDNKRRRIPAAIYLVMGAAAIAITLALGDGGVLVNGGVLGVGIGLVAFGLYGWVAGYPLRVDENEALVVATRQAGFPVGHASAQLGWRGLRSRPTWRMLLFSADDPPTRRGLVLVDGVDGSVVDDLFEDNVDDD